MATTKYKKQTGLSFYSKVKKIDGEVICRRSPNKVRVFNFIKANHDKFKWIYIKITYGKPTVYNEGKYLLSQKEELLHAWRCFTEEELIRDALTY